MSRTARHSTRSARRWLAALALLGGGLLAACQGAAPPGAVHVLTADGTVNGVMQRYIERGIDRAEREDAAALVILVNTPGGGIDAMRNIVSLIETAEVPVITFVSPAGARAASAGTFIVMAGHVAAMAPSTTIGAAAPVTATGGDVEGTLGVKVTEDTAAFARGVARTRGRNEQWADQAVRDAVSASSDEAVELNVVDLAAPALPALLTAIEGRSVELIDGESVTLALAESELVFNDRNLFERVLGVVSDPLVVSLLLLIGLAGLAIEFFNPGLYLPGVLGVTAVIASFLGVGTLLPGEAAFAFILFGIALIALEWFIPAGGALGTGGAIAIVLGLSILVGQGSTELDWQRLLTILVTGTVTLGLLIAAGLLLVARNYRSVQEPPGEA